MHSADPWTDGGNDWSSALFSRILPVEVPVVESYFVLFDARFASHVFGDTLTRSSNNSYASEYFWCFEAKELFVNRPGCYLIPLASKQERATDPLPITVEIHKVERTLKNNPKLKGWANIAMMWYKLVGSQSLREVEHNCRRLLNVSGEDGFSLEKCAAAFLKM